MTIQEAFRILQQKGEARVFVNLGSRSFSGQLHSIGKAPTVYVLMNGATTPRPFDATDLVAESSTACVAIDDTYRPPSPTAHKYAEVICRRLGYESMQDFDVEMASGFVARTIDEAIAEGKDKP